MIILLCLIFPLIAFICLLKRKYIDSTLKSKYTKLIHYRYGAPELHYYFEVNYSNKTKHILVSYEVYNKYKVDDYITISIITLL